MRLQFLPLTLLVSSVSLVADVPQEGTASSGNKLWAAISVNGPIFEAVNTKPLIITFAMVNDGDKAVNPEVESSKLLVNGEELEDWPFIIANGIRDDRWQSLPAGDYLYFTYDLGRHFRKPGIYRIAWRSKNFRSPEIVLRIMPKREK